MAKELPSIGELEMQVLQEIWRQQPCTEREVWESLCKQRELGRTTVLKTMQRLESKGLLCRVDSPGTIHFRATVRPGRVLPALVRRFVDTVLGGSTDPLVAYLSGAKDLSAEDVRTLRAIAEKLNGQDKEVPNRGRHGSSSQCPG